MTDSLSLSIQCVLPVILMIALGIILRKTGLIWDAGSAQMDKLCFKLLLPLTLFKNIYNSDFKTDFNGELILIAVALTLLSFAAAVALAFLKEKDAPKRAALAQSIFRNNSVVFGLPIMTVMYGQAQVSMFSLILAFAIPLNNVLAVVLISLLTSKKISLAELVKRVAVNPFVIFCAAALLIKAIGLTLPQAGVKVVTDLAAASTPIALLSLGAGLHFGSFRQYAGDIIYGTAARLVLLPLLFMPLLVMIGVRGAPLTAFYFIIGTPCAVASYIMAKQMGADGTLAGHMVVFQSLFSCLTIFLTLLILGTLGLS